FHRVEKVCAQRAQTAIPSVHYYRARPVRYVVIVWRIGAQIPADPPQGTIGGGLHVLVPFPVSALARSPLPATSQSRTIKRRLRPPSVLGSYAAARSLRAR